MNNVIDKAVWWLLMVVLMAAPWAFGCVHPLFELYLGQAVVLVLSLGVARYLWNLQALPLACRRAGLPGLGLLGLVSVVLVGLLPMGEAVVSVLSPSAGEWRELTSVSNRESFANATPVPVVASSLPSGGISSLNPFGNFQMALRLAGLGLIFLTVAGLPHPMQLLRSLAWCATVLGGLIALVSILQSVSPERGLKYWFFESPDVFGLFMNRNHYPFLANMLIGLTLGLLLDRFSRFGAAWQTLLQDSVSLWLMAALAMQLAAVTMSLSRGGICGLVMALALCLVLRMPAMRFENTLGLAVVIGMTLGFLIWVGFDLMESRLTTLAESDTYREDGRWYLWQVACHVFTLFPVLGAGGETFRHWETTFQFGGREWNSAQALALRADNEYLDLSAEYGIFALICLLVFLVPILVACFRMVRHDGLMAGALVSLLAVTIHSFFDFGLRIPATALFAVTIAGICYAARPNAPADASYLAAGSEPTFTRRGTHPLVAMFGTLAIAVVTFGFSATFVRMLWRSSQADQHKLAAYRAVADHDYATVLTRLSAMGEVLPDDVMNHIEVARIALLSARSSPETDRQRFLEMAKLHCVQARDVCPLTWESPFWLSEQIDDYSDPRKLHYLDIAGRLHPSNSTIAFQQGKAHWTIDDSDLALAAFRRSLFYSSRYLGDISGVLVPKLGAERFVDELLPEDVDLYVATAEMFARQKDEAAGAIALQRAVALVKRQYATDGSGEGRVSPRRAAQILAMTKDLAGALEFQRRAIQAEPMDLSLRGTAIDWLIEVGDLARAKSELRMIQLLGGDESKVTTYQKRIAAMEQRQE